MSGEPGGGTLCARRDRRPSRPALDPGDATTRLLERWSHAQSSRWPRVLNAAQQPPMSRQAGVRASADSRDRRATCGAALNPARSRVSACHDEPGRREKRMPCVVGSRTWVPPPKELLHDPERSLIEPSRRHAPNTWRYPTATGPGRAGTTTAPSRRSFAASFRPEAMRTYSSTPARSATHCSWRMCGSEPEHRCSRTTATRSVGATGFRAQRLRR